MSHAVAQDENTPTNVWQQWFIGVHFNFFRMQAECLSLLKTFGYSSLPAPYEFLMREIKTIDFRNRYSTSTLQKHKRTPRQIFNVARGLSAFNVEGGRKYEHKPAQDWRNHSQNPVATDDFGRCPRQRTVKVFQVD